MNLDTQKYKKYYDDLVSTRRSRGLDKTALLESIGYLEIHHITPRCLGGKDTEDNLVLLTAKEHILAHKLLSIIYPNNVNLQSSIFLLTTSSKPNGKPLGIREAARLREEYGKSQKERNQKIRESNIYGGYALSEKTRERMSKSRTGHPTLEKTRKLISESERGKKVSLETRKRLSNAYIKASRTIITKPLDDVQKKRISDTLKSKREQQNLRGTIITDGNITYYSTKECANSLGISIRTLKNRLKDPDDILKIVEYRKISKKVIGPNNEIYNSILECSIKTGHAKKTIRRWISDFPEKGFKFLE